MVEIKPYLSDEDEDENWIPLNPRTSHHSVEQPNLAAASPTANIVEGGATNILPAVEDEDEEWEKLSSSHIISEHQAQAAEAAPVSSLMELFPALSSITKVTTASASEENDDENSESGENIVWRRPNALDDDKEIQNFSRDRGDAGISERYDDDKISAMRFDPSENNELHMQGSISKNIEKEKSSAGNNEKRTRQDEQQSPPRPKPQQQQQRPHPSTRIKSKLQEKFIHDPLRSLPYHFMRNFFLEAKYQLTLAWKCYFSHDDADRDGSNELSMDTGALAAVILYSIVGMFALGLILSGIYDVGLALLSTLIWSMETSLKTSGDGIMSMVLTTLILGMVICLASRFKSRDWFQETFRFPTLSNIVPMIVAFTSTSMYEAAVIGLSVRTIISICETGAMNMGCPIGLATVGLVFISSTFSIFLAMNLVSFSELEMGENHDSGEIKVHRLPGKYIRRMRALPYECHALGIAALVVLCIALILLRDGVFIFSSLRLVRICLSIGIGIFTLESLWNSILEAIASKNNLGVLNGMSLRHISRRALTKALFDLSTSAFWSKDDVGNVMLGILSEEDSELRYAILGWILDRWTATSNDQSTEGREATANDQLTEEPPSLNEPNSSPEESQTPGSTEDPRPPLRSKNSASCSHSDGAKFETKDGNDGRCNEAEFRATSSDFPANDGCRSSTPSYQSLQSVISRLDADETLIPAISRYSEWVNSLRPNPNVALCLAMWKLCPAMVVFGVATIFSVLSGIVQAILFCTIGSTSAENIGNCLYVCIVAVVLWPLLLIEYFSLSHWWAKHFEGQEIVPDSVMIMLESEDLSPRLFFYPIALATDTSAFLLRVWKLLLESISFLQSSVPAVRCATAACCTADLAVDTLCLVDLAFEVQKRGVIGGIGMLIFDAFNHHLREELQQRRSNEGIESDEHEGLDSKYTDAVINSARNIGKISQNIGGLMQKEAAVKSEDHDDEGRSAKEGSSENSSAAEDYKEVQEVSTDGKGDSSVQGEVKEKETSPLQSEDDRSGAETQETCTPKVEVKSEEKKEGDNHLMPVLIGGGLAVLGAFVGGMTVAAAKNRNDDEKRSSKD